MKIKFLFILLIINSLMQVNATDFYITNGNDDGTGSLRQAIMDANADLTSTASAPHKIIPNASYSITALSKVPFIANFVVVNPEKKHFITITGFAGVRIIYVLENGSEVTLNNIILQGASEVAFGGALGVGTFSKAVLNNCTFQYNSSQFAALTVYGDVTCNNCSFHDNVCTGTGNGCVISLVTNSAKLNLNSCIIENNTGGPGIQGRAFPSGVCTINIDNCIIRNNLNELETTWNFGAGVASAGITTITNTEISGNSARLGAGVSFLKSNTTDHGKLTMSNCTVSGNTATANYGGGIWIQGDPSINTDTVTITNCTISGNSSFTTGAGISFSGGSSTPSTTVMVINNSTITGNTVSENNTTAIGGGIGRFAGEVILNYCIVAGNNPISTANNKDIYVLNTSLGSTTGRNLYGGKPSFGMTGRDITGNINFTDDILINLLKETLEDNGGKIELPGGGHLKTHALVAGGLAVDPLAAVKGFQTKDQRGFQRDITPDMGSFESNALTAIHSSKVDFKVYQSGKNIIMLDLTKLAGQQDIIIYDSFGRIIAQRKIQSGNVSSIFVENLPKGLLLISIQGNKDKNLAKIVTK